MWVVYDPELKPLVVFLCIWIKMNISGTFVLAYVQVTKGKRNLSFALILSNSPHTQAMEVFPTCVRQSGIGFATLVSQMISLGGPHVIFLGITDSKLPYLVMFLICLSGAVATLFLPETLGRKLPETIKEAVEFGRRDKFFSFLPEKDAHVESSNGKVGRREEGEDEDEETTGLVDWNQIMKEALPKDNVDPKAVAKVLRKHAKELS